MAAIFRNPELMAPVIGAMALALLVVGTFRSPLERVLPDTAFPVFGLLYIGLPMSTVLPSAQDNGHVAAGSRCWWCGRATLPRCMWALAGRWTLRRGEPNKTWEGSIASIAASVGIAALRCGWRHAHGAQHRIPVDPAHHAWMGLAVLQNSPGR